MTLSPELLAESEDERSQELATTASIFPELQILSPSAAAIAVPVSPVPPLPISFPSNETPAILSHLPPVIVKFDLPAEYPANAPTSVEITTDPAWLPDGVIEKLRGEIDGLWEDFGHDQIVYTAIDHIQQCAETGFELGKGGKIFTVESRLGRRLVEFDGRTKKTVFEQGTYDCGICLEPKKGVVCHRLRSCTHVFCRSCLIDYYTNLITEGEISSVRCIDPACVKKATRPAAAELPTPPGTPPTKTRKVELKAALPPTLPPEELDDIGISEDMVKRYGFLKRKKALEVDPETIYCPRQWCQAPTRASVKNLEDAMAAGNNVYYLPDFGSVGPDVAKASQGTEDTEYTEEDNKATRRRVEKLQVCSSCTFAFCRICKMSWHGDFQICRAPDAELTPEERANEEYLRANTTPCPTCLAPVLKSHGCNHMICGCQTHFCFLCSAFLPSDNPYHHFNTRGSMCYQRLWEGEEGDEENVRAIREGNGPGQLELLQIQQAEELIPAAAAVDDVPAPAPAPAPEPLEHADIRIVFEDDTDSDAEFEVAFEDVPDDPPPAAGRGGRGRGGRRARGGGRFRR